jgi:hypothetical protein
MAENGRSSLSLRELGGRKRREGQDGTVCWRRAVLGPLIRGFGCGVHLKAHWVLRPKRTEALLRRIWDLWLRRCWGRVFSGRGPVGYVGQGRRRRCLGTLVGVAVVGDAGSDAQQGITHCVVEQWERGVGRRIGRSFARGIQQLRRGDSR